MDEDLCASGFQLKKDYPLTGMLVLCDRLLMHPVFQNLLENALKYASPQTRIFNHASQRSDQFCEIRNRNTSRVPLDIDPEEITKRYVRGEKARSGEGSGAGSDGATADSPKGYCGTSESETPEHGARAPSGESVGFRRRTGVIMAGMKILGWGSAHGDRCVSNEDMKQYVDTSDEWIRS